MHNDVNQECGNNSKGNQFLITHNYTNFCKVMDEGVQACLLHNSNHTRQNFM